ncbi:PRC-barrel domain-containing protein [Qipengyuania sp.]|uniref:PRC-barrel domain-containing protein n=1 Tax=Qipengyuania sp. TaxID=2004515 RepID=UPI003736F1EA
MNGETIAQYLAPAATMIAAMMTAANLGARMTGSGFVVFTIGSLAWTFLGFAGGQTELIVTNAFLTLVNIVGIWRWLGRQRSYEDGAKAASAKSRRSRGPTLMPAAGIAALPLVDEAGEKLGHGVDILLGCDDSRVSYVVVGLSAGEGLGERLVALGPEDIALQCDRLVLKRDGAWLDAQPALPDGDWPDAEEALGGAGRAAAA